MDLDSVNRFMAGKDAGPVNRKLAKDGLRPITGNKRNQRGKIASVILSAERQGGPRNFQPLLTEFPEPSKGSTSRLEGTAEGKKKWVKPGSFIRTGRGRTKAGLSHVAV